MAKQDIWSAINISEGRDLETLKELASRLKQQGVPLADWSADSDHHRSVFSLVGDGGELLKGLRIIFSWAEENLDLRTHLGQHPRLGAVDVVPFAPVGGTSMTEVHKAVQMCTEAIAQEFKIPIFLYRESSVSSDSPLTLPNLRRGGPTRLKERMESGELVPQFGPSSAHPQLGVSIFGARPPLVAFNCQLNTKDMDLGRSIAGAIRESGGGLKGLQALAFPLASRDNTVQISMNLIEPSTTPPHLAYLKVVEEAEKYNLTVVSSELVGLVPNDALKAAFSHFLKMPPLRPLQVVETHPPTPDEKEN